MLKKDFETFDKGFHTHSKLGYDSDQPILWDYGVVTRDPDRRKRKPSSLTP